MIRVGPRTIRAREFVDTYFDSYAEYRPPSDSAGRIEYMNNLVNREVMALEALKINRPLSFEDRATMREYSQRVLSNTLLQRAVFDSVNVTDAEARRVYDQMGYENRFRHMLVKDYATALKVYNDLKSGKIGWANAYPKYNLYKSDTGELGDMGFVSRDKLDPVIRIGLYDLKPGEFGLPFEDPQGWHVIQVTERRKMQRVAYEGIQTLLKSQVFELKASTLSTKLTDRVRAEHGVVYNDTNLVWASSRFTASREFGREGVMTSMKFSGRIPHFDEADTSRVLARYEGGQLTLGAFLAHYRGIQPLLRQPVNTPTLLRNEVDTIVLEPFRAQLALEMGLDKDPLAVAQISRRKEALLVDHLYEDSVGSKVWLTPEMRKKYYQDHIAQFVTFPEMRFAIFATKTKGETDSLMARLRAGEKPEAILLADSLRKVKRGSIQSQTQNQEGLPYHTQLFEELKPGDIQSYGPDEEGAYIVINPLQYKQGRQLSYAESEKWVDESLQNIEADRMLQAYLARHRPKYPIETHPERVMQLLWIDPASR